MKEPWSVFDTVMCFLVTQLSETLLKITNLTMARCNWHLEAELQSSCWFLNSTVPDILSSKEFDSSCSNTAV